MRHPMNVVSQCLTGWSAATPHDKELAHRRLQEKFDVDLNDGQMFEIVERHCRERYKEHRSTCHKKYKELKLEGKDPIQHKPSIVKTQDDWEWMCAHFESEGFLKRSAAATRNRAKIPYNHHGGTISFVATREALSTQEEPVGPIELFRRMHSTAKGRDNQLVESHYKEMVELQ